MYEYELQFRITPSTSAFIGTEMLTRGDPLRNMNVCGLAADTANIISAN